jgi:hypothetical protein
MKRPLSPRELYQLQWRPVRVYRTLQEAWPTHYPQWWEAPQRQRPGARAYLWFSAGMVFGVMLGLLL